MAGARYDLNPVTHITAGAVGPPGKRVFHIQATQGLPRKLNAAAHYTLSAAALTKAKQVTAEHVQTALEEL